MIIALKSGNTQLMMSDEHLQGDPSWSGSYFMSPSQTCINSSRFPNSVSGNKIYTAIIHNQRYVYQLRYNNYLYLEASHVLSDTNTGWGQGKIIDNQQSNICFYTGTT